MFNNIFAIICKLLISVLALRPLNARDLYKAFTIVLKIAKGSHKFKVNVFVSADGDIVVSSLHV